MMEIVISTIWLKWVGINSKEKIMALVYPNKHRRIVDIKQLPFEPSMTDVLSIFQYFQDKYQALPSEVVLEERSEKSNDHGAVISVMVFSRVVNNENYETEVQLWNDGLAKQVAYHQEIARQKKIKSDGELARQAWQSLHRQERISRKHLGRYTLLRG
jgi:hypothetical protein